jgi:hypothetical protein
MTHTQIGIHEAKGELFGSFERGARAANPSRTMKESQIVALAKMQNFLPVLVKLCVHAHILSMLKSKVYQMLVVRQALYECGIVQAVLEC